MATTGKTGADAMAKHLKKVLSLYATWSLKFISTAQTMNSLGLLTAAELAEIVTFFNALAGALTAIQKVAEYAGFDPDLS